MMLKKYGLYATILLMITTVALPIKMGAADFSNGSKIFISDIAIVVVSIVYFILVVSKRVTLNSRQSRFLRYIIIFVTYLFITAGIHTLQSGLSKEYITLIRNFYAAAFFLVFLSSDKISKGMIENILLLFITGSNMYQIGYLLLKFEIRSSQLFYNVVLYTIVAQMILAFLFKLSSEKGNKKNRKKQLLADINIFSIVFLVPLSGLRSGTAIMFALVLFYVLYFMLLNGKRVLKKFAIGIFILSILTSSVLAGAYLTGNTKILTVFSRTFNLNLDNSKTTTTKKIDTGKQSDEFRNAINDHALEDIKDNLWIGTGKLLVGVYDRATKKVLTRQPHNFMLEWLLGYGLIGTIYFIYFLLLPYFRPLRFRKLRYYILSASILVGLLAFSMVQPTMNRILPLQIFFMLQIYLMKCDDLVVRKKRKKRNESMNINQTKINNTNFNDNVQLRELQLIMLKNMKIVHQICVENNIKYSLCGGSTVGAIVHKGFVPWDDDIDIMMDRLNYDRFCRILPKCLPENLELINYKNSRDMRTLISKIVDKEYQVTYQTSTGEKIKMGLYIDITVLDKVPVDMKKRKKLLRRSRLGLLLIGRNAPKNQGIMKRIIGLLLVSLTTEGFKTRFGKRTEEIMKKGVRKDEDFIYGELLIYWGKLHEYDKDMFDNYKLVTFEDAQFYVVSDYDRYLWARYDRDYRILPPKEEQVPHHGILAVDRV